jgi:hypothetical protein
MREMGKRQLLFVTYGDENLEEGASYAIELAKAMYENITLLLVRRRISLMDKFGDIMTAVTFSEAGEHGTARELMADNAGYNEIGLEKVILGLTEKCRKEGIDMGIQKTDLDVVPGIRAYLKDHSGIDKVVLSPAVTGSDTITAKDLNRLVRTASRPIVTMTRQACTVC